MKRHLHIFFAAAALAALCIAPAHALEYNIDAPDDYLFGRPTSDNTIYEWENPNVDRSKNTALIPPGFGTPTSYLPNSGEYLTPNLVPGALSGGLVNQAGSVGNPNGGTSTNAANSGYPAAGSSVTVDSSGYPMVDMSMFGMSGSYIPDANFHSLRHTFATRALEQGMDVVTLSRLLGHATPSVTLDKYGHALNDHKRASVEKLGGIYSAGRGIPRSQER